MMCLSQNRYLSFALICYKKLHTLENHLLMNLNYISHLLTFISSLLLYTQIRIDYGRVGWGKISQASAGQNKEIDIFLMRKVIKVDMKRKFLFLI